MENSHEKEVRFIGTYFDRDRVLQISRMAGLFAWISITIYVLTTLVSFIQFMFQFMGGLFYQKGITIVDLIGYFTPYFIQLVPGMTYFGGLKFVQHALLILLDVEDNTRRNVLKK